MKFLKKFSIAVAFRILVLFALLFALSRILGKQEFFYNQIILGGVIIALFFELLRYVNRTNREVSRFVDSLLHDDHAANFSGMEYMGKSFEGLGDSFTQIAENFKKVRAEKEGQYQYLLKILENVPVGIITIHQSHIEQLNQHALDLLEIPFTNKIEHLATHHPSLAKILSNTSYEKSSLIELTTANQIKKVFVKQSEIILLKKTYKVISIQDIGNELAQQEVAAWNQLISILTHEMMNSVTPITSLSETMNLLLLNDHEEVKQPEELEQENVEDLHKSLLMIRQRSEGILTFIDGYRKVSRVPQPTLTKVNVKELADSMATLFKSEFDQKSILFEVQINTATETIDADFILLEQVFINLITNSIHALKDANQPFLSIIVTEHNDAVLIEIKDNGKGIPNEKLAKIFVPFYTTREDGTGIGLSISKQIMMAHGGDINVKSKTDQFTSFYLTLKK